MQSQGGWRVPFWIDSIFVFVFREDHTDWKTIGSTAALQWELSTLVFHASKMLRWIAMALHLSSAIVHALRSSVTRGVVALPSLNRDNSLNRALGTAQKPGTREKGKVWSVREKTQHQYESIWDSVSVATTGDDAIAVELVEAQRLQWAYGFPNVPGDE